MRRFRAVTTGHAVIMGRRTWESLPQPLTERQNIVVDPSPGYDAPGAEVAGSLDAALAMVRLPVLPPFASAAPSCTLQSCRAPTRCTSPSRRQSRRRHLFPRLGPQRLARDRAPPRRRRRRRRQHGRTRLSLRHLSPRALTRWDPRCAARGATSRCAGPRVSAIINLRLRGHPAFARAFLGRDGGTGIRSRLKICRPQGHEGSIPSPGTTPSALVHGIRRPHAVRFRFRAAAGPDRPDAACRAHRQPASAPRRQDADGSPLPRPAGPVPRRRSPGGRTTPGS